MHPTIQAEIVKARIADRAALAHPDRASRAPPSSAARPRPLPACQPLASCNTCT